jgi:GNAT superfamily N-acetyltransferase
MKRSEHRTEALVVRAFSPQDQVPARALILEGFNDHFSSLDPDKNHDLDDIASSYAGSVFLVASQGDQLVGTGVLVPGFAGDANVVRMSVVRRHRRQGVGTQILDALVEQARASGFQRVTLGTNDDWDDAIGFYNAYGFHEIARTPGGVAFALDLSVSPDVGPAAADSPRSGGPS